METKQRLLFLEDDIEFFQPRVLKVLSTVYDVDTATHLNQARTLLKQYKYDVALLDRYLPDNGDGIDLIPEIRSQHPGTAIVMFTTDDNYSSLRKALGLGAYDYVIKPTDTSSDESSFSDLLFRLSAAVEKVQSHRKAELIEQKILHQNFRKMVGTSPYTTEIKFEIQKLKGHSSNVMITGESGTGKELIAELLNQVEDKAHRPFQAINCSAIPENLFESEFFGHKKGAFTGAHEDKKGVFELANGGDLFLDEVADLSKNAQSKLLRVLQDGKVKPVGSSSSFKVEVRVISATNKNIEEMVENNEFRRDLYYRLNVVRLETVPLRERKEDIPEIANFFLHKYACITYTISKSAIKFLCDQEWQGNIRELKNWIERGVINAKSQDRTRLEREDFIFAGPELESYKSSNAILHLPVQLSEISQASYEQFLARAERAFLEKAVSLCSGNISRTADILGIGRTTLYGKLKSFGLNLPSSPGLTTTGHTTKRRGRPVKGVQDVNSFD